jgi:hypothetical protein
MLLKFKEGNRVKIISEWLENENEAKELGPHLAKLKKGVFKIINSEDLPKVTVRLESEEEQGTNFTLPEYALELI